jgi:hygromycin-B 7''-O-kinase
MRNVAQRGIVSRAFQLMNDNLQETEYWQSVHKQPLPYWQKTLDTIRQRHQLPAATRERFSTGKNIVFAFGDFVIKLSPPFWGEDLWNEVEAMEFVANRLPVTTPELVATGEIGLWRYYVVSRAPGN